jgi:hypothetical protein
LAASIEQVSYNSTLARHRAEPARFGAAVFRRTHKKDPSAAPEVMPLSKRRAKIALANLFRVDRFSISAASCVEAVRSDVSRGQSRCFNDLQGLTSPHSATVFDNGRRIRLKPNIPLV